MGSYPGAVADWIIGGLAEGIVKLFRRIIFGRGRSEGD
jgi:hypothetical protein